MTDKAHEDWLDRELLAHKMEPVIGELFNRQGIEIKIFGKNQKKRGYIYKAQKPKS